MPNIFRYSAVALIALAACEVVPNTANKQDTTVLPASPSATAAASAAAAGARADSVAGVPAAPSDSATSVASRADTGIVQLYPSSPRRGGVVFALAAGLGTAVAPRCSWKGSPIPCYLTPTGVLATIPLPAEESAGTFQLTFENGGVRIARQITVADRSFGRQLVLLDKARWALLSRHADVARDARVVRGLLSAERPERRWRGRWKEPLPLGKSAGYGVDRFYAEASDSARAITLDTTMRSRGAFGGDTIEMRAGDVPSWRHAGVDVPARKGAVVTAPGAAVVADVGDYVLTGRTVLLDHGQGVFSAYFHLDTALVERGDAVRTGKAIGRVGATGLATGPHLHYGIYLHGRDVDPAAWRDMPSFVYADTGKLSAPR